MKENRPHKVDECGCSECADICDRAYRAAEDLCHRRGVDSAEVISGVLRNLRVSIVAGVTHVQFVRDYGRVVRESPATEHQKVKNLLRMRIACEIRNVQRRVGVTRRRCLPDDLASSNGDDGVSGVCERAELIQRIKEALEDLDPELRAIIVFRVEDELTRMEIEDRLQLSPKAIIWREERAYETLRRVLSRHAV